MGQLVMDQTLQHDAMMRAIEISLYYSHTRPNGESCFTAFTTTALSKAENIALGQSSASVVMNAWMNSDGHRTNILNSKYKEIGIGCFYHNGRYHWVQLFANSSHSNYTKTGEEWVTGRVEAAPSMLRLAMAYSGSTSLTEGDTLQFYVTNSDGNDALRKTILVPDAFTWSVSDSSLATISSSGVLTAKSAGTVLVKAQLGTLTVTQNVTISHEWSTSYRTITAATCTGEGSKGIFCTHCGKEDTSRRTSIPKLGHSYGSWKTTKAATCTADGVSTRTCTRCGAKQTKAITKLGHSYGSWKTTKAATCLAAGKQTRTCSRCKTVQTRTLAKLKPTITLSKTSLAMQGGASSTALKVTKMTKGDSIVSWTSSNTSVVTVNAKTGKLTAKKKAGTAYITAKLKSGISARCKVTVTVQKNGWIASGGNWYYYVKDVKQTGWKKIGNYWYYLYPSGYGKPVGSRAAGWLKSGSSWRYLLADGRMAWGLQKVGGKYYYFGTSSDGVMKTGWQKIGNYWYYFQSSGVMQTGWLQTGGKWYYFLSNGRMVYGLRNIGGKYYYFGTASDGMMKTGWQRIGSYWYYFQADGAMKTGWLLDGGNWYYLLPNGRMAVNITISGGIIDAGGVWHAV